MIRKLQQRSATDHAPSSGARQPAVLYLLLLMLHVAAAIGAETTVPTESQVKAACLFSLSKYVEWPPQSFPDSGSPIRIGLCGQDRLGDDLRTLVAGKLIDNRKITVDSAARAEQWRACHILFISGSEVERLPEILSNLKGFPVLTVSESPGFLDHGGIVNLVMKDRKVRLEINAAAAEKAGLRLSARLLAAADVVRRQ